MKIKLLLILLFIVHATGCESSLCDDRRTPYVTEIKEKVAKKITRLESGRPINHLVLRNFNDSIIDLSWIGDYSFDTIKMDDSVYKNGSSLVFNFYRAEIGCTN